MKALLESKYSNEDLEGKEAPNWRGLRTEAFHHFHKGWSSKSPVILDHFKQIRYFKICKTSLLAYDIMSKTQDCIWPGCSPHHLSDDVFVVSHIFQTRHSISAHYDGKEVLAVYPPSLCCLQESQRFLEISPAQSHRKTCACYWAFAVILDKYRGRKYSGPKKHKLQMALSHGCGQHIFQVSGGHKQ